MQWEGEANAHLVRLQVPCAGMRNAMHNFNVPCAGARNAMQNFMCHKQEQTMPPTLTPCPCTPTAAARGLLLVAISKHGPTRTKPSQSTKPKHQVNAPSQCSSPHPPTHLYL